MSTISKQRPLPPAPKIDHPSAIMLAARSWEREHPAIQSTVKGPLRSWSRVDSPVKCQSEWSSANRGTGIVCQPASRGRYNEYRCTRDKARESYNAAATRVLLPSYRFRSSSALSLFISLWKSFSSLSGPYTSSRFHEKPDLPRCLTDATWLDYQVGILLNNQVVNNKKKLSLFLFLSLIDVYGMDKRYTHYSRKSFTRASLKIDRFKKK